MSSSLSYFISSNRWSYVARPNQLPPPGNWFVWVIRTGRGWGKSRSITSWLDSRARTRRSGEEMLLAGRTPADVRAYELYGPGGLLTNFPDIKYYPSKRELVWPNGVKCLIRSGANPEEFRGFSGDTAALLEFAAWDYPQECWENLIFGMREGNPQIGIGTTPRPVPILREIYSEEKLKSGSTVLVTGSTYENKENLSSKYFSQVIDPLMGSSLGRREIEGIDTDDNEDALWKRKMIDPYRISPNVFRSVQLEEVVVGVDPQGNTGYQTARQARETGIVVAGRSADNQYYVFSDDTLNGTPLQWGGRAVKSYHEHQADYVAVEVNFGGDMAESTISNVDDSVMVQKVVASRGKVIRASPIVVLYEKGLVHHVGLLSTLEDEMCNWTYKEKWSPNRLDALVWALKKLSDKVVMPDVRLTWGSKS